jgi:hypothetical protein
MKEITIEVSPEVAEAYQSVQQQQIGLKRSAGSIACPLNLEFWAALLHDAD